MKELLISIYEMLKYATEHRTMQRKEYFDQYVELARAKAEEIYHDHRSMLATLRGKVEAASRADPTRTAPGHY